MADLLAGVVSVGSVGVTLWSLSQLYKLRSCSPFSHISFPLLLLLSSSSLFLLGQTLPASLVGGCDSLIHSRLIFMHIFFAGLFSLGYRTLLLHIHERAKVKLAVSNGLVSTDLASFLSTEAVPKRLSFLPKLIDDYLPLGDTLKLDSGSLAAVRTFEISVLRTQPWFALVLTAGFALAFSMLRLLVPSGPGVDGTCEEPAVLRVGHLVFVAIAAYSAYSLDAKLQLHTDGYGLHRLLGAVSLVGFPIFALTLVFGVSSFFSFWLLLALFSVWQYLWVIQPVMVLLDYLKATYGSVSSGIAALTSPPKRHLPNQRSLQLSDILSDATGFEKFTIFAATRFCVENVLFWKEVQEFRNNPTLDAAILLRELYLQPLSPLRVSISSQVLEALDAQILRFQTKFTESRQASLTPLTPRTTANLKAVTPSLFDACQSEAFGYLERDLSEAFFGSEAYATYRAQINKDRSSTLKQVEIFRSVVEPSPASRVRTSAPLRQSASADPSTVSKDELTLSSPSPDMLKPPKLGAFLSPQTAKPAATETRARSLSTEDWQAIPTPKSALRRPSDTPLSRVRNVQISAIRTEHTADNRTQTAVMTPDTASATITPVSAVPETPLQVSPSGSTPSPTATPTSATTPTSAKGKGSILLRRTTSGAALAVDTMSPRLDKSQGTISSGTKDPLPSKDSSLPLFSTPSVIPSFVLSDADVDTPTTAPEVKPNVEPGLALPSSAAPAPVPAPAPAVTLAVPSVSEPQPDDDPEQEEEAPPEAESWTSSDGEDYADDPDDDGYFASIDGGLATESSSSPSSDASSVGEAEPSSRLPPRYRRPIDRLDIVSIPYTPSAYRLSQSAREAPKSARDSGLTPHSSRSDPGGLAPPKTPATGRLLSAKSLAVPKTPKTPNTARTESYRQYYAQTVVSRLQEQGQAGGLTPATTPRVGPQISYDSDEDKAPAKSTSEGRPPLPKA